MGYVACRSRGGPQSATESERALAAEALHAALKAAVRSTGIGQRVRVNHSGRLSQCGNGPMVVVYPEGVWYAVVTPSDVDEIVSEHLQAGRPVERLRFDPPEGGSHELERDADGRPIGRSRSWPARTDPTA